VPAFERLADPHPKSELANFANADLKSELGTVANSDLLSRMLARTPAALKKRRYRRRLRDGVCVLHPEVDEAGFAEALQLSGRLSENETLDRDQLTHAAARILREFTERWLRG